jgi:hypothetical protein
LASPLVSQSSSSNSARALIAAVSGSGKNYLQFVYGIQHIPDFLWSRVGPPAQKFLNFYFLCHIQLAPPHLYGMVQGLYQKNLDLALAAGLLTPSRPPATHPTRQQPFGKSSRTNKHHNNACLPFLLPQCLPNLTCMQSSSIETGS